MDPHGRAAAVVMHWALAAVCLLMILFTAAGQDTNGTWPEDFFYGCATSAYQIEGAWNQDGKGVSVWDDITHRRNSPVANHDTGDVATDHYHRYKEDVKLLAGQLGVDRYSFTIAWSRILPNGRGPVNPAGIKFYTDLLAELHRNNITPVCTLYHWDHPQVLQHEYGGFLGRQIVDDFANYASVVFQHLGDQCDFWITMNEPGIICTEVLSNVLGKPADARQLTCGHHALLAHAAAVKVYRQQNLGGQIGIIIDGTYLYPLDPASAADKAAAERGMQFYMGWLAHPLWLGDYPPSMKAALRGTLPEFTEEEIRDVKGSADFLAFDAYTSAWATPLKKSECDSSSVTSDFWPSCVSLQQVKDSHGKEVAIGRPTQSDWNYQVGSGLRDGLKWLYDNYHPPALYVTENGMGVIKESSIAYPQVLNDVARVDWYKDYLDNLRKAIYDDRLPVKGFVAWSCLDNFEWTDGYTTRFGITYVDYKTLQRSVKQSAAFLKKTFNKA